MVLYGEETVASGIPTVLIESLVEHPCRLESLIAWGDTAGNFEVWVGNQIFSGCRTSNEHRTIQVYWHGMKALEKGEICQVVGTHSAAGNIALKCNLILSRI